jgi:tetratricopeptide (TPR) repeat protein
MPNFLPVLIGAFLIYYLWSKRSIINYNKGIKALNNKDFQKGIIYLEKAVAQGVSPMQEIRAAYAELKFGDIKKARIKLNILLLNSKLKENFKNEAKCILAIVHINQGEIEEAREILDNLYKTFKNTNFYATYGYVAIATGEKEYYTKINADAYEYNSSNTVICDNYAHSLYLNGDYDKSEEIYQDLMEKNPNFPEAYYNYALVLKEKSNIDKAKEMLELALTKEFYGITTIKKEQVEDMLKIM